MIDHQKKFRSNNESDSLKIASNFMLSCKKGDRIILNGELGAGKTFFIKAALSSIGIKNVSSPSFAIVNEYQIDFPVYHFDFYRLKNSAELFDIGWQDYLNNEDSIIFIEWGNRFPEVLPNERIEITIDMKDGTEREFRFKKFG